MSKPLTKIEETLSVAYVTAVIGITGNSLSIVSEDYGTDISIRKIANFDNQIIDIGPIFDCQLKATINWIEEADDIVYDMEAKAYNKLIFQSKNASIPVVLVLLCLPKDKNKWVQLNIEELKLRKCCFYKLLDGEDTQNSGHRRIRIPKKNIFCPDCIEKIISEVS